MLSPADLAIVGAFALIFFGPEKLPQVARKVGQVVRDVQNTSQSFIREMERAADEAEMHAHPSPSYADVPPDDFSHHADGPFADDVAYLGEDAPSHDRPQSDPPFPGSAPHPNGSREDVWYEMVTPDDPQVSDAEKRPSPGAPVTDAPPPYF